MALIRGFARRLKSASHTGVVLFLDGKQAFNATLRQALLGADSPDLLARPATGPGQGVALCSPSACRAKQAWSPLTPMLWTYVCHKCGLPVAHAQGTSGEGTVHIPCVAMWPFSLAFAQSPSRGFLPRWFQVQVHGMWATQMSPPTTEEEMPGATSGGSLLQGILKRGTEPHPHGFVQSGLEAA